MKIIEEFTTKKNKKVQIVLPTMDMLDEVLVYANKLAKEDTFLTFHPAKEITKENEKIWLENQIQAISDGSTVLFWAVYNGKIVGSVDINRGKNIREWHTGTMGIMVDSDFRGEGLGLFLMELILQKAKEAGIRTAELACFSDNAPALALYKKVGLKEYGRLPDGLYRKQKFSDKIYMYKQLLD